MLTETFCLLRWREVLRHKYVLFAGVAGLLLAVPNFVGAYHIAYPPYVSRPPAASLKLPVPFHAQEHSLSCEAATLRMLLLSQGIDEPENWITAKMAFGPMGSDPDLVYVGNHRGTQFVSGYGIHWDALAHVAREYQPAESFHRKDLHFLIDRLHDGNPVIVWGSLHRSPSNKSWTTPEGKYIHAVSGQHTWVVTGYAGDRRAPSYLFTLDPIYGERVFRTGDFLKTWSYYNNSGIFLQ